MTAHAASSNVRVHRIEIWPSIRARDPLGASVQRAGRSLGIACDSVRTARVYLLQGEFSPDALRSIRDRLLRDPILEEGFLGSRPTAADARTIEVHPLPGVMDPAAQTVQSAIKALAGIEAEVITGARYDLSGVSRDEADVLSKRLLSNPVIERVHSEPWTPDRFPRARAADQALRHVTTTTLGESPLMELSRKGHLFLNLQEMQAIQEHFRARGREPTDIELETIAQTWSEHCVHKTLKSTVRYREGDADPRHAQIRWENRPGVTIHPDRSVTIHNLLKSTVAAATHELMRDGVDWPLSVFVDNAGVIAFDEQWAINVKVETHNRPSAIEPYGGAATGVGGCIRDVIGTGLGAKPIANTDVFCVAMPDLEELPPGVLHPKRVLSRVIDGVRDYGNRMGIPTVNGAVYFDNRYVGNPLVYCGCVGLMRRDMIKGEVRQGDRIIALGGRTGRDGIHGATFSSAELTHTHADEFAHAVQIGNAIEEKRLLDAILRARDHHEGCLFHAITDCGAGGFSSAVGEMGSKIGAEVHLDRAPLKYAGLRYDEIWISESQERMVLAVPERNIRALRTICDEEGVGIADLGVFGTPTREIILHYNQMEVGRLACDFLHDGIPMPTREAHWAPSAAPSSSSGVQPRSSSEDIRQTLLRFLSHPNIASKRWIVRQYDHEVQGMTVIKPLVGAEGIGPGDATVIQPVPGSKQGIAIACGLATSVGDPALGGDPYLMAIAAVDECVRNLICVGADPDRIAILDNFCWPSCENPQNMASLVRAAVGCYDAAKAYRTPFVSGKDSLNNQFRYRDPHTGREVTIEIPPTLLITGVGIVPDVERAQSMNLKSGDRSVVAIVKPADPHATSAPQVARAVAELVKEGLVLAAHDSSEGGPLVALAEMLIAAQGRSPLTMTVDAEALPEGEMFRERVGCYLIQFRASAARAIDEIVRRHSKVSCTVVADVHDDRTESQLVIRSNAGSNGTRARNTDLSIPTSDLRRAFLGTLDW